ncbi:MAG TPA: DMT family transporter [Casimicrobiaceae bacterium]|nr:DMT family transporter [Casimicrobiaceae bacterium]
MRGADLIRLVALAAIWGGSFVSIRVIAEPLGPLWTAGGRVMIAAIALAGWLALIGVRSDVRKHWFAYFFAGIVGSALPFVLFAFAALTLPASYMAILNALSALFAALLAALVLNDRFTLAKLAGIACGIGGVALVSGAGALAFDRSVAIAILASVAAAFCYAVSSVWLKRNGAALDPRAVAANSQLAGGIVLLPPALLAPPPGPVTALVLVNLVALALLSSGIAYVLYFRLIRDIGPTRTLTVTFLLPAFGMLFGALFLHETITLPMLGGAALILAGGWLVLRPTRAPIRAIAEQR